MPIATVYLIAEPRAADAVSVPEVPMYTPAVDVPAPTEFRFEDSDVGTLPGIVGIWSAPRVDPSSTVDRAYYAQQAGLAAGQTEAVVLLVEVQADGSVGEVIVDASDGTAAMASAAIAYARALRWIPGSVQRRPCLMRIRYAVTFVGMTYDRAPA